MCAILRLFVSTAMWSGVEPGLRYSSPINASPSVFTMIAAPLWSRILTQSRLPATAAKCSAVRPPNDLWSMYFDDST